MPKLTPKTFKKWFRDNLETLASATGMISQGDVTRQAALHFKDPTLAFTPPAWVTKVIKKVIKEEQLADLEAEEGEAEEGDANILVGEIDMPDGPRMFLLRLLPPFKDFKYFVVVAVSYRDNAEVAQDYAESLAQVAQPFGGHLKCEVNNIAQSVRDAFYFFKRHDDAKNFAQKVLTVPRTRKLTLEEVVVTGINDPNFAGLLGEIRRIEER